MMQVQAKSIPETVVEISENKIRVFPFRVR